MHVKVLFFGLLRDLAGRSEERAGFPDGMTLGEIYAEYATRHPALVPVLSSVLMARNQEFAPAESPVSDGDEIAFLPP
ncbi:MAG: MoaD/ThiS family protein, partial [Acidobacteria bacterium]|nr:MoaD/ThiS family protein [Acidobacteriota bacterium]